MPSTQPKQIAVFRQTHDSFSNRVDKQRTEKINRIFSDGIAAYNGLELADVSKFKLNGNTNEAIRAAVYSYHQKNQLAGILGIRVIGGKHNSSLYNNGSSSGYTLYEPLQREMHPLPLDVRSVTIEHTIMGGVVPSIYAKMTDDWAAQKGIVPMSGTLFSNEWVFRLYDFFDKINKTMAAVYGKKNGAERKKHEINKIINDMVSAGYLYERRGKELKASSKKLADFLSNESIHDFMGALRMVSQAAAGAYLQYIKSVGFDISKLMMGEFSMIANNQLYKEAQRGIISSRMEPIGAILESDLPAAHLPIFYVPSCVNCETNGEQQILLDSKHSGPMDFLPCTDMQLTVECADRIIASKEIRGEFVKIVANWAKKL